MKKITFIFLGMVLMVSAVFANGNSEKSDSNDGVTTIQYITSTILESPEGDWEKQKIAEFESMNPDIKVEAIGIASGDLGKKYVALATANDLPDVFQVTGEIATNLADLGVVSPVEEIYPEDFYSKFTEPYMNLYSLNDTFYGIPWFSVPPAVIYRKDIFDAQGLEIPTTWEDFVDVAKALTGENTYGVTLVGVKTGSGTSRFQHVMRNFGVDEFYQDENGMWQTDLTSKKFERALKEYTDLDVKYGVVPPGVIETDYSAAVKLFSSGKAAMIITGSNAVGAITAQVPELKGKLGSFLIPNVERYMTVPNGSGFYVCNYGEVEAASKFVQFLCSNENLREFEQLTGRVSALIPDPNAVIPDELKGFVEASRYLQDAPNMKNYNEIVDILGTAFQNVFSGVMTAEEAAEQAGTRAQALCDKANK